MIRLTAVVLAGAVLVSAVEPGMPSKTSVWTAISRAIGAKNPDPEFRNPDYLAAQFLGPRERALLAADYPVDALDLDFKQAVERIPEQERGHITAMFVRTRQFDLALTDALDHGVQQVVVLGAGFDSRAYRFKDRLRNVRFFEVDYGPTQEYKKQRVAAILGSVPKHVNYVPIDFTKEDLLTVLRRRGYSEQRRTVFLWEGVSMYIPEAAVRNTFKFVLQHSGPGSTIAFNYILSRQPDINNPNSRYARWGEPWVFGFPGDSAVPYVKELGLEVLSDASVRELVKAHAMRPDGSSSLPLPSPERQSRAGARICLARVPGGR